MARAAPNPGWLTPQDAGEAIGLSDQSVIAQIKAGKVPRSQYVDCGKGSRPRYFIDPEALTRIAPRKEPYSLSHVPLDWTADDETRALQQELQETRQLLTDARKEIERLRAVLAEKSAVGLHMAEALRQVFANGFGD